MKLLAAQGITVLEICRLCNEEKELCQSHAIPDSIFTVLFSRNSGKAILLTSDEREIEYITDSLDTKQLCDGCEKWLNQSYESYSINLLRNTYRNTEIKDDGVHFIKVDVDQFMKFILAIFWRAAVSTHECYKGAVMAQELLPKNGAEKLRKSLYENSEIPSNLFSVKIRRLRDSTGCWDLKTLKDLIVVPFPSPYGKDKKVSVNFAIEGFYFSVVMPGLSDKGRRQDLVLYPKGEQFVSKYIDFLSINEMRELIASIDHKMEAGKSGVSIE